ncbi:MULTISPECIES: c-type cytochrome [Niastella]|uniref:Cytochrome c n=1 Tax=Niastella soli TaxID=2821487 RepID=A0ABS3YTR7_9BACT|nr:cytochrome c [Niastella soli]MBO9201163.1 cytochrome c [Niastella soli]
MKRVLFALLVLVIASAFGVQQQKPQPGNLKAAMTRGKTVYEATCLACHQPDGLGVQNMNPPLVKTKWVLGDKKALIKIVLKGLQGGEIEIDGDKFHNPMPPQESTLSDQEIADVLTYIRNSFGNKASLVSMGEVKAVRAKLK